MTDSRLLEFNQWQLAWGTPKSFFTGTEGRGLEVAFLLALILHMAPFGFLWHKKITKPIPDTLVLQNVEFIDLEPEVLPAPPPVEVQKPKSALEFLKMALPIFRKQETASEIPREIPILPKFQETKLAEPERLVERKMPSLASVPKIELNQKTAALPKAVEIAKTPQVRERGAEPATLEPALKLEEVGKRVVAQPQAPAIRLDRAPQERAVEIAALPKTNIAPLSPQPQEKLVERTYRPASGKSPSAQPLPLGYERKGSQVNLESPRDVMRATPKLEIEKQLTQTQKKEEPATIQISKKRVEIAGPLSQRKLIKSFVPDYPDWAKAQNIEADVAIRFTVSPAGDVVSMKVQRTSGYPALDKSAMEELKKWKFSGIDSKEGDQWGVITFRFLLE